MGVRDLIQDGWRGGCLRKWQAAGAKPGRGSGWGEGGAKRRGEYTLGGLGARKARCAHGLAKASRAREGQRETRQEVHSGRELGADDGVWIEQGEMRPQGKETICDLSQSLVHSH